MQDLSVDEMRDLHVRLVSPHSEYAYREARDRMMVLSGGDVDTLEDVLVSLSLRLEIIEASLKCHGYKDA